MNHETNTTCATCGHRHNGKLGACETAIWMPNMQVISAEGNSMGGYEFCRCQSFTPKDGGEPYQHVKSDNWNNAAQKFGRLEPTFSSEDGGEVEVEPKRFVIRCEFHGAMSFEEVNDLRDLFFWKIDRMFRDEQAERSKTDPTCDFLIEGDPFELNRRPESPDLKAVREDKSHYTREGIERFRQKGEELFHQGFKDLRQLMPVEALGFENARLTAEVERLSNLVKEMANR